MSIPQNELPSSENSEKTKKYTPLALLFLGIIFTIVAMLFAVYDLTNYLMTVFSLLAATCALILTFVIARQQDTDTSELNDLVSLTYEITREIRERQADSDYATNDIGAENADRGQVSDEQFTSTSPEEHASASAYQEVPGYRDEVIEKLKEKGARLDFENLIWKRKTKPEDQGARGSLGWFVETAGKPDSERWFVRKARGLTVRKAMPRHFLEAFEAHGTVPSAIKLDYQLKEHGNAAWYARTYDGRLFRLSKGGRRKERSVNVEEVRDEDV